MDATNMNNEKQSTASNVDDETKQKKLKYPTVVFFIIGSEFCEKFSYLGMRVILSLYLSHKLNYTDDEATVLFHTFNMLVFFFPVIGGILADSLIGKFKIILYLSIVYSLGQLVLATCAVPTLEVPRREFTLFGLFLIALGTGGIKPCVPALGADQFILPQQEKQLTGFFTLFYFTICCSSLISAIVSPELRTSVSCFGEQECYSLAFLVPAILMILATVIFGVAKPLYRLRNPETNIVLDVFNCISHAISNKMKSKENAKKEHWLDYATPKYDTKLIEDVKAYFRIVKLFLPMPLFWTLFDLHGSRWTFQATRMDGEVGSYLIKPDQMHIFNAIMVITFIPLFDKCVYPLLNRIGLFKRSLARLATGTCFIVLSFLFTAILEYKLEATYPVLPTAGHAQLRIFNPRDCYLPATINNQSIVFEPFSVWADTDIRTNGNQSIPYTTDFSRCSGENNVSGFITAVDGQITSYVLEPSSAYSYKDFISKTKTGKPAIRVLSFNTLSPSAVTKVKLLGPNYVFETTRSESNAAQITPSAEFQPGKYSVEVNGKIVDEITIKLGGVYTLQVHVTEDFTKIGLSTITPPNSIHILWQLPQYIVSVVAEVMCIIPGLNFIFSQAPASMKSLIMAFWLMTNSAAHLIVITITAAHFFDRQIHEFLLYAVAVAIATVIFILMIRTYEYRAYEDDAINVLNLKEKPIQLENVEPNNKTTNTRL